MIPRLTFDLLMRPEQAWPVLAHHEVDGSDLPAPRQHLAAAALVSVLATGLGSLLKPGTTSGGFVLQMAAACLGYLGGPFLATELLAAWSRVDARASGPGAPGLSQWFSGFLFRSTPGEAVRVVRFAATAQLPIALSGVLNVVPLLPMSFALAFAGAALSVHSGWIGASAMLALEGQARIRAAAVPAGLAVGVVLLATCLRMVLPP